MERPPRRDPIAELFGEVPDRLGGSSWRPSVDVWETEKAIVVQVELAGVSRENLKISIDGSLLRIRGERLPARDAEIQRLHQMEIATGQFERVLRIAIPFEREDVRASLDDGYLRIVLPKRGPLRRRIPVEG